MNNDKSQEIENLKIQIDQLKNQQLNPDIQSDPDFFTHNHNGINSQVINWFDIFDRSSSVTTRNTSGTISVDMNPHIVTLTPTGDCTINAVGGVGGTQVTFIITTSGTTRYTITFGTNFTTTGVITTGTTSGAVFTITFTCTDGMHWYEMSRTPIVVSTNYSKLLYNNFGATTTSSTTETTVISYTLPANTVDTAPRAIKINIPLTFSLPSTHTSTMTFKLYFGSSSVLTTTFNTLATGATVSGVYEATINTLISGGSGVQYNTAYVLASTQTTGLIASGGGTTASTTTNSLIIDELIKVTITATDSSCSATAYGGTIQLL